MWHDFRVKNDDGKMGKAIKIHSPEFTSNRPADDHIAIGRKAIKVAQNLRKNCVLTRTSLSDGNLSDPPPPCFGRRAETHARNSLRKTKEDIEETLIWHPR